MPEKLNDKTEQIPSGRDTEAEYPSFNPEAAKQRIAEYKDSHPSTINPLAANNLQKISERESAQKTYIELMTKRRLEREEQLRKMNEETERQKEQEQQALLEREQKSLQQDMSNARSGFERKKEERLRNQRSQEIIEKDLNSRLLSVDNLETEVLSENPDISKRFVPYENDEVTIYDLKGLPYSMLTHTVDYRRANKEAVERGDKSFNNLIGTKTYLDVMNDPTIWTERRDVAEASIGFGSREADARGDTISCSFHNSETNNKGFIRDSENSPHDLIYGFEKVEPDSVISIDRTDGGTSNIVGKSETQLNDSKIGEIEKIQKSSRHGYNEVLLRRYSENGVPKRPDYIVAINGRISDAALRHAKYFGVPIVNIEESIYDEKQKNRGKELMESINEDSEYLDCYKKIEEILSMDYYHGTFLLPNKTAGIHAGKEEYEHIRSIEFHKRIDYLKKTIENAAKDLESNLKNGADSSGIPEEFDSFNIELYDAPQQKITFNGNTIRASRGSKSYVMIDFIPRNEHMKVETILRDDDEDGEFYPILEPAVRRYLELLQQVRSGNR